MIVFVIPLKSKKVCQSWERVCQILERTIRSTCNQTSSEFRVIVVSNEEPEISFEHSQVTYLKVDFPPPKDSVQIVGELAYKERIARGLTDKGRKVLAGLTYAKQFNPSHAMVVDSDDCVSRYLAEFVQKNATANGWFINQGYKYQEGSDYIYLKRSQFYRMSGTANIIRFDLLDLPEEPEYNRGYGYYKFHLDHQKVKDYMSKKGKPIKPLPFPGSVYLLSTGDNMSGNDDKLSFSWLNRKKLTPEIQKDFCLYKLNELKFS